MLKIMHTNECHLLNFISNISMEKIVISVTVHCGMIIAAR